MNATKQRHNWNKKKLSSVARVAVYPHQFERNIFKNI